MRKHTEQMANLPHIKAAREALGHERVGMPWGDAEVDQLIAELHEFDIIDDDAIRMIAERHKRTVTGIRSRIEVVAQRMLTQGMSVSEVSERMRMSTQQVTIIRDKRALTTKIRSLRRARKAIESAPSADADAPQAR
jgi:hypothetical protein